MRRLVPGDPAALSDCASAVRRTARLLEARCADLHAAYDDLAVGWAGRQSVHARRAGGDLAVLAGEARTELADAAGLVADYATDLAELRARERLVHERAAAVGLEVRDGRVELPYGVSGEADPTADADRRGSRAELDRELDGIQAVARRRRESLTRALDEAGARLAELSARARS